MVLSSTMAALSRSISPPILARLILSFGCGCGAISSASVSAPLASLTSSLLATAFALSDFLFTAITMRPDGKRPSMECLVSCYFATFGEFAKAIQKDQSTTLEQLVKASSKWQHIWKESISNWDSDGNRTGGSAPSTLEVPSDLTSNRKLINSLTNVFDNRLSKFKKSFKGGGGGKGRQERRWRWWRQEVGQ